MFKHIALAGALALAPLTAAAATVTLNEGGTTNINLGDDYAYQETDIDDGATRTFTLEATPPDELKLMAEFVTLEFTGAFENLMIMLVNDSGTFMAAQGMSTDVVRSFSLDTVFNEANGFVQELVVSWTNVTDLSGNGGAAQFNIQATPSAVPVPAAGGLLLLALGGVAAFGRRKTA